MRFAFLIGEEVTACYYVQQNTHEAKKNFDPQTYHCSGGVECQFRTLDEAKQFCNAQPDCTEIVHHSEDTNYDNGCYGGHGCFSPRKGVLEKTTTGGSFSLRRECGKCQLNIKRLSRSIFILLSTIWIRCCLFIL